MTAPNPRLTDALLKEVLTRRAAGPSTSAELLGDVLAVVQTMPQGHSRGLRLARRTRLLPVLIAAALLLAALIGFAVGAGSRLVVDDPNEIVTRRAIVEPFLGLPPEGAAPSSPETGDLVFTFVGRVEAIGNDVHWMWLYADGRLIWRRNLDSGNRNSRTDRGFGTSEPTVALIEQRLTPAGVEHLRSEVMRTARIVGRADLGDDTWPGGPGVWPYGQILVGDEDPRIVVTWSDAELPGRLADPASWLPTSAWEDQRIAGYVPSRYCFASARAIDELPESTRNLLRTRASGVEGLRNFTANYCLYELTTEVARAVGATLDEAGLRPVGPEDFFIPVLPDGEVPCFGCG